MPKNRFTQSIVMVSKPKPKSSMKPVTTLVKKRSILVPALIICAIIVVVVVVLKVRTTDTSHGKILATVNGQPIYEDDVRAQYNSLPAQYQQQYDFAYVLNQTIDQTLLLQEAKNRGLSVSDAEIQKQLDDILAQYGIGPPDLDKILAAQNITLVDYRKYIGQELLLNKVINDAVVNRVSVTDAEVAQYYEQHQDEFVAPNGSAFISHILVNTSSEAEEIITRLEQGESFDTLARNLSEDTASAVDGGFLGLVSPDSDYVPEFKNASLQLSEGQFTRTPVKSQYGYHVILRDSNTEPLSLVRSDIEQKIKLQKQVDLFQTFMQDLRSKATIKYYTTEGVVTQKQDSASLDDFASCVSTKATLYGTKWSEFFAQQQDLFGVSFDKLNYVDCDNSPSSCAEAHVQKYPTWVINGTQYGLLSLANLSDKTGCALPEQN